MPKTVFQNGTIVSPAFLNAINNPAFVADPQNDGEILVPPQIAAEAQRAMLAEASVLDKSRWITLDLDVITSINPITFDDFHSMSIRIRSSTVPTGQLWFEDGAFVGQCAFVTNDSVATFFTHSIPSPDKAIELRPGDSCHMVWTGTLWLLMECLGRPSVSNMIASAVQVATLSARQDISTEVPELPSGATKLCSIPLPQGKWIVSGSIYFTGSLSAIGSMLLIAFVGFPTTVAVGADSAALSMQNHPQGAFTYTLNVPDTLFESLVASVDLGIYAITDIDGVHAKAKIFAKPCY